MHSSRPRAPLVAAVVNGAVVLLSPAVLVLLVPDTAVHAYPVSPAVRALRAGIYGIFFTLAPASLVAWRTWVHARRWQAHQRTFRGVAEAGLVGVLVVFAMLAPAVLVGALATRSIVGFFAIPVYAAIGGVVGLVVGLILHLTAVVALTITSLWCRRTGPREAT